MSNPIHVYPLKTTVQNKGLAVFFDRAYLIEPGVSRDITTIFHRENMSNIVWRKSFRILCTHKCQNILTTPLLCTAVEDASYLKSITSYCWNRKEYSYARIGNTWPSCPLASIVIMPRKYRHFSWERMYYKFFSQLNEICRVNGGL